MTFVHRHRISSVVVCAALLATVSMLALALAPRGEPADEAMIDFSKREYSSPERARQAFRRHGVDLAYSTSFGGVLTLSNDPSFRADTLQVSIAPRTGEGSWGPKLEPYDERFGNLLVSYGGNDAKLLARVEAAVAELRK